MIGIKLAGVMAVPVAGGLGWRKVRQRQVAKALEITTPNGIVEQHFVKVGGIDQWLQLRGEDRGNPVLLVLHGGPGWPNAVFSLPLRPWERHFTVVQWDHRGAGKTLGRNGKAGSGEMTFARRVADAIEVIEFLRQYLSVEKVVVLAESMGTLTGLPLAKRRPDLFHALVATDLYVNMAANEARKYQLTLERVRAAGNAKGVAALERIGADPARWDLQAWNTNMAWAFRTNVPTPNLDRRLLFPLALTSPIYTLRDLSSLFMGFQWSPPRCSPSSWPSTPGGWVPAWRSRSCCPGRDRCDYPDLLGHRVLRRGGGADQGLALIPDAGHFAAFTQPQQFLTELRTRVRPLAAPPSPASVREP
jgi:pimeloyl-ACP methyl ester carboxylesterase